MNPNYKTFMQPRLRMSILQLMPQMPNQQSNSSVLSDILRRALLPTSRDEVKEQLRWLAQRGLVAIDEEAGQVLVVHLTRAGLEVVHGNVDVEGVEPALRD